VVLPVPSRFKLCIELRLVDSQRENAAGTSACATQVSRVPARSVDRHIGGSRSGDHDGSERDLQLRTAYDLSA